MLLNISNHPKSEWSNEQIAEAERLFGSIVDYPFPKIPPEWDSQQTESLANNIFNDIISGRSLQDLTVHIMGEMTFCFALIGSIFPGFIIFTGFFLIKSPLVSSGFLA